MLAGIHSTGLSRIGVRARRSGQRQTGLTLVELLVAFALLGFVLLAITPLFTASVRSNYAGNEYTSIHVLARDRLERLMSLPFSDAQLAPGRHDNDLSPMLPDPRTGLPPSRGGIRNPFSVCYRVFQFQIPPGDPVSVPPNTNFLPIPVTAERSAVHYKRIDVTVVSGTGALGIGLRKTRVSGLISNPDPAAILSTSDPGGTCP
jgi:pilin/secretion family protein with methylation motif